jgi:hypothetical protein
VCVVAASAQDAQYFGGYHCTDNCREHADGFVWARQNRVREPGRCAGPTLSHLQGCMVYLRDRMRDWTKDDSGRVIQ